MDLNQVTLIGRIAGEIQYHEATETSKSRAHFRLAINRVYSKVEKADYIPITCWDVHADNLKKYCSKGKEVAVTGQLETNSTRNEDGTWNNFWTVRADAISYGRDSAKTQREGSDSDVDDLAEKLAKSAKSTPKTSMAELVLKLLEKGVSLEEAKELAAGAVAPKPAPAPKSEPAPVEDPFAAA